MRPGRGLIDQEVYEELIKIPGAAEIVISSVSNHRWDSKTKKLRVEIAEDVWPEVKAMVRNLKRMKAGKPQVPFQEKAHKSVSQANVPPEKPAAFKFRKGMKVKKTFFGLGDYKEEIEDVVESVIKGVVRTEECGNGITFDAKTGMELENFFPGMHQEIVPLGRPTKPSPKKSK